MTQFEKDFYLVEAAKNDNLEEVKNLIQMGASIHFLYSRAFRYAARDGHLEIVKYLHSLGIDVTLKNNAALYGASFFGYLDVVKYIIDNSINKNVKEINWARRNSKYAEINTYLETVVNDIQ